ncbi:MAG: hypothetical protein IPJ69_13095 [Deltaproteobacteria bacterium]|nr:MAG: hypothetical protein IPJ69_13095 [Deltaproteobacteria bacterium]
MMDAIRIVDPEAASTINNEFVEGYATAVQDFVNGKKTDIDTFRKKLLLTIFLSSKLKEMVRKQLNLCLDAAKEWIDAHPGTIPWPFNEPGSMIQVLTESLLPHLRGYFAKNKTTLKEDAAPISDFSDIGYFNLLRWLPVLIQNYRKNNNLTELQKVYFIMGMRPLDPDFPELENQAYAASKPLFEWSQAEPENTTHRKITTQMKTAINQAQILTTPSGSYILLGDNPALQDLRRFFSSEKVATYKGTSVQDDFLLSPIILTTQLGCRLKPINDLTDSEKTTLGWLAETLSSFQSLTTENNLSLTVAEHLIHRRETYHADVWKKLIAATRGPQENLHYRLSRAVAHYRI